MRDWGSERKLWKLLIRGILLNYCSDAQVLNYCPVADFLNYCPVAEFLNSCLDAEFLNYCQVAETRDSRLGTRDSRLEIRDLRFETRDSRLRLWSSEVRRRRNEEIEIVGKCWSGLIIGKCCIWDRWLRTWDRGSGCEKNGKIDELGNWEFVELMNWWIVELNLDSELDSYWLNLMVWCIDGLINLGLYSDWPSGFEFWIRSE